MARLEVDAGVRKLGLEGEAAPDLDDKVGRVLVENLQGMPGAIVRFVILAREQARERKRATHRLELVKELLRALVVAQVLAHDVEKLGLLGTEVADDGLVGERRDLVVDDVLRDGEGLESGRVGLR